MKPVLPRGRAAQMNTGAAACPAQVLLLLHADTQLPDNADALVQHATLARHGWGRFDVHIDSPALMLRIVGGAMSFRSRRTGTATGDQAIFVRQDRFDAFGGFPDIPLREDIALSTARLSSSKQSQLAWP